MLLYLRVVLNGPGVLGEHCALENLAGTVTVIPQEGALCSVNGSVLTGPCQLTQGKTFQRLIHLHSRRHFTLGGTCKNADSHSRLQAGSSSCLVCKTASQLYGPGVVGDRFEKGESVNLLKDGARDSTFCPTATHALEHSLYTVSPSKHFCYLEIKAAHNHTVGSLAMLVSFITILIYPIRSSNCRV